jgi:hypothetical protein
MASQKCVVTFLLLGESFKDFFKKVSSINAKSTYLKKLWTISSEKSGQ